MAGGFSSNVTHGKTLTMNHCGSLCYIFRHRPRSALQHHHSAGNDLPSGVVEALLKTWMLYLADNSALSTLGSAQLPIVLNEDGTPPCDS
jgi:hypothetical protein